jgi:hypothetical protein
MERHCLTAVIFDTNGKIVMTVNEVEAAQFATQGIGTQSSLVEIIRCGHLKPVTTTLPILIYDPEDSGIESPLPGEKRGRLG